MTNLKLMTNASAVIDTSTVGMPFIMLKFANSDLVINTGLAFEDYPDFEPKPHKVYVDENDKILIKCNLDLLDTPIRASMVIGQGVKPEYKYDEYV